MAQTLVRGFLRRVLVALGLSICLPAAVPAWSAAQAQVATIADSVVTSTRPLSQTDLAQIEALIRESVPLLTGDDPEAAGNARNRLLAPLEKDGVGVPFRLAYSNALCPLIEPLAGNDDEVVAINALRILGELATDRATNTVEPGLNHTAVGVRYTAVYSVGRTFEAIAGESPAVAPQRAHALIDRIAELLRNESDPWILDAAARALIAAGAIDKENFEDVRAHAYNQLSTACSDRVRSLPMEEDGVDRLYFMLRAAVAVRDAFNDTSRSLSTEAATAGAALGGDALTFAILRIQRGDIGADERSLLNSLAKTSQANIFFAAGVVNPTANLPTPQTLPDPREPRNDADFVRRAVAEIDRLYTAPFSFPARRFERP